MIGAIENLSWYHVDANTGRLFHGARDKYEAYVKYDDVPKTASEAAEIIRKWAKEHPEVKTRQDAFFELFPKAKTFNGLLDIYPAEIGKLPECNYETSGSCHECRKAYWLAPEEDEK